MFEQDSNLSTVWPLDLLPKLLKHVEQSGKSTFTLQRDGCVITLHVQHEGETHNLATFPDLYITSLTILLRKRAFYWKLFQALAPMKLNTPALVSRQFNLQDHWLREVVYLDRVLQLAIIWSRNPIRGETCQALFLLVAQEATGTDHSLESTRHMRFTRFNHCILGDSQSSSFSLNSAHPGA